MAWSATCARTCSTARATSSSRRSAAAHCPSRSRACAGCHAWWRWPAASVVGAGADAVMTTFGTARRASLAPEVLRRAALVLSLDVHASEPEEQVLSALRLGADSVKVLAVSGDGAQWSALERYALIC